MSDTYRDIIALRAIRDFSDEALSLEDTEKLLQAARWTGSSKNRQDWSFVLVTDPDQKARVADCGDFTRPVRNAPAVLALVQEPGGYEFDIGRVAQNVMLAADALGMAACPITLHRDGDAAEVLGLPQGRRCRYAVAFGYPAPSAEPGRFGGRKSLEELVHIDEYGSHR